MKKRGRRETIFYGWSNRNRNFKDRPIEEMMMNLSADELIHKILDFMVVIHQGYKETNYANDRPQFANHIAWAMDWIAAIKKGENLEEVVKDILSPQTCKPFGDYMLNGVWFDKEMDALKQLRETLRQ